MSKKIVTAAVCEIQSVVRFMNVKNIEQAEIYVKFMMFMVNSHVNDTEMDLAFLMKDVTLDLMNRAERSTVISE